MNECKSLPARMVAAERTVSINNTERDNHMHTFNTQQSYNTHIEAIHMRWMLITIYNDEMPIVRPLFLCISDCVKSFAGA